ncbi:MAG: ATP-binding cassette domain-containing protein [Streptosporangiales bacterium]|nr:ATP-binding cassette domain-containing protein [Streptosporangiales bacterium]
MRPLPAGDPGVPEDRSAPRYLLWLARRQLPSLTWNMTLAIVWMVTQAVMPATVGEGIDEGLTGGGARGLLFWCGALLLLGAVQAAAGVLGHRMAVYNWLCAAYRTVQVVVRQAGRLGATLPRRMTTGEVVSVGTSDIAHIGSAMEILSRAVGSLAAIAAVSVILLNTSVVLGLVVVVGVPVMAAAVAPVLRPLHVRQHRMRELQGELTTRATDIVAGLRVLRGVGGEDVFAAKYAEESQRVRRAGVRVGAVDALLQAMHVLLPGVLVVGVTWLGARMAISGQISVGQLVAFYGYTAFLIHPIHTLTEAAERITRGLVAARRVTRILQLRRDIPEPDGPVRTAPAGGALTDSDSGLTVRPGLLTAVAAVPSEAEEIAARLGRFAEGGAALGGVPLARLPLAEVRSRVLVAASEDRLFTGSLRDGLDPHGTAGEDRLRAALWAASAGDMVGALPGGLDAYVAERGREFSGGQQQRLRLARALAADPEVLVLVEPTSAVDAHTEAVIAERLLAARAGRTTVVFTGSPLVLDQAEHVVYVEEGKVLAEGTHAELLEADPRYAAAVTRGSGSEQQREVSGR